MRGALTAQIAVAAILLLPVLVVGETFTFSDYLNHVWTAQFADQFISGDLYPRWLETSFSGMGAPSFYFYPPAFYLVASTIHALSFATIPTQYLIPLAAFGVSAASGAAMYALLRQYTGPTAALIGGICYQLAPYHLTDFYVRGALGEYTAFVFTPLIVLGMGRFARSQRGGAMLLPIAFAGLIYSHLPTTVLLSSVLPLYALFLAFTSRSGWKRRGIFLLEVGGLAILGMAIAAAYLVPALSLIPFMTPGELWAPVYQPDAWFIWNVGTWPLKSFNASMIGLSSAMAVAAACILVAERKSRPDGGEASFWAAVTVASLPLILGLVPWYWHIGPIAEVQFPFRLLAVAEFAFVFSGTLFLSRRPLELRTPAWIAAIAILLASSLPLAYRAAAQVSAIPSRADAARTQWESTYRDFDGFLPPQFYADRGSEVTFDQDHDEGDGRYSQFATRKLARLALLPEARLADGEGRADARRMGAAMSIDVDAPHADTVVLRRFYFPGWAARDEQGHEIAAAPTADGLVSFRIPGGSGRYVAAPGLPDIARYCLGLSVVSAIGLALACAASFWKRSDHRAPVR